MIYTIARGAVGLVGGRAEDCYNAAGVNAAVASSGADAVGDVGGGAAGPEGDASGQTGGPGFEDPPGDTPGGDGGDEDEDGEEPGGGAGAGGVGARGRIMIYSFTGKPFALELLDILTDPAGSWVMPVIGGEFEPGGVIYEAWGGGDRGGGACTMGALALDVGTVVPYRVGRPGSPDTYFGANLDPSAAFSFDNPAAELAPGDLRRWIDGSLCEFLDGSLHEVT